MQIGQITLNLSSSIYLIWLLPQITHNFLRKDTEGLSFLMHGILGLACLSDLLYGYGTSMPWQYRIVSIATFCGLAIQHFQIGRYGLHQIAEKNQYKFLNILFLCFIIYLIYTLKFSAHTRNYYDLFGVFANIGFLSYALPQIIKNYSNQSTIGISKYFIYLSIFLNLCDTTSAWSLNWDYPSKIGPIFTLLSNLILISQMVYYSNREKYFIYERNT